MLKLSSDKKDKLYAQMLECVGTYTVVVKFKKKDGTTRVLMGTRNKVTVMQLCNKDLSGMLAGFDKRCNIGNYNIPVVDLALGEVRTFCIDRLEAYQVLGFINSVNAEAAFTYLNDIQMAVDKEEAERRKNSSLIEQI